jgi:sugar/nucleoside kinase (ribokinase family)
MAVEAVGLDGFAGSSVCVVGNLNRDLKTAPIPAGAGLERDGETSVAFIAETVGGGGANSAFAAAALGAKVSFVGKVGADALGDRLEGALCRHGIAAHLARDAQHASGTSLALALASGQRHFVSCLPANQALAFADLDLGALAGHQHLLRADIWFSEAMLFGGNERLLRAARQAGLETSIDLNWDPRWGHADQAEIQRRKAAIRAILPWVTLAHGNRRELTEFAEASDLQTALRRLTDWGVGAVVVHLGREGAGYYENGSLVVEPPVPARRQVHATGTGDVLSVCMILLHRRTEMPICQRLHLANRVVTAFIEGRLGLIPELAG